mgnify:CR=1 FL=1
MNVECMGKCFADSVLARRMYVCVVFVGLWVRSGLIEDPRVLVLE